MLGFTKSLRGRFAAYFTVSIVFSLLISGLLAGVLVQRSNRQRTVNDLKFQTEALSRQIEAEGLPQGRYIRDLELMYQTVVFIAPYHDQALGRLPQSGPPFGGDQAVMNSRPLSVLDWDVLREGGTQVKETDLSEAEPDVVIVAHGFDVDGEIAGAVVMAKPVRLFQSWRPLAVEFVIAGIASLAVSLLLSFLLARRLSRPLHEITQAATAVAEGDLTSELTVRSDDEIGHLADAFRYMTDEVRQSQEQQRQFVINVSHELKTPLTAIAGHAQALQDGIAGDPEAIAKSSSVIVDESRRLSRLIEDLLSLAKFDARQFELKHATVAAGELIQAVIDGHARDADERGVDLSAAADSPAADLTTDPDRLRQILSNLVQNALIHTPSGGKVTISTRVAAGNVEIEVADTGAGIEAADLPRIFDRFYRGGGRGRDAGLGLGLAISRDLAQALGGDITAASTPGRGSRFTVSLPLAG